LRRVEGRGGDRVRAELQSVAEQIKEVVSLLRRHL